MGGHGFAILVSKEDLKDIVIEVFIVGFINKYHSEVANTNFTYEEDETDLLYNVSIGEDTHMIEIDLSEYKTIIQDFIEYVSMICQREIPDLSDKYDEDDTMVYRIEHIENERDLYEIYYCDTGFYMFCKDHLVTYLYCNEFSSLEFCIAEYYKVHLSKDFRSQFNTLFENKEKLTSIFDKVVKETDLDIRDEFIWT